MQQTAIFYKLCQTLVKYPRVRDKPWRHPAPRGSLCTSHVSTLSAWRLRLVFWMTRWRLHCATKYLFCIKIRVDNIAGYSEKGTSLNIWVWPFLQHDLGKIFVCDIYVLLCFVVFPFFVFVMLVLWCSVIFWGGAAKILFLRLESIWFLQHFEVIRLGLELGS